MASNELVGSTLTGIFIAGMLVGWIFYFASLKYWKGRNFWDKYTTFGVIKMMNKINTMPEPGKTYAKISAYFLVGTPILLIIVLLILKILGEL